MQIEGKVALVTGGAKRIGREIVLALAERKAKLAVHYHRSDKEAAALSQELHPLLPDVSFFQADLSLPAEAIRLANAVTEQVGPIDILINNASTFEKIALNQITEEDWDRHMNINLKSPFLLCQAAAKAMLKTGGGKIINITDYTAIKPSKNYLAYNVSKAGLSSLTRSLAKELAPHIQVNALALGPMLPPEGYSEEKKQRVAEGTLAKRWGEAKEVANAVLFLLEGTDYATGSVFYLEGGKLLA